VPRTYDQITCSQTASDHPASGQNGFALDHTSGSHFIFYNSTTRRRAVVPSHNRDLPKGTLMSLLREAGFTREELMDFLAGR
jgi:predicted RNA binding protein YcfA (HicA-like mRNA interferase family)